MQRSNGPSSAPSPPLVANQVRLGRLVHPAEPHPAEGALEARPHNLRCPEPCPIPPRAPPMVHPGEPTTPGPPLWSPTPSLSRSCPSAQVLVHPREPHPLWELRAPLPFTVCSARSEGPAGGVKLTVE